LHNDDDAVRWQALNVLMEAYRPALVHYARFAERLPYDVAEDHVQAFLTDRIVRGTLLEQARVERGRLRSLLRRSFRNYILDEARRESANKRSPGAGMMLPIDEAVDQPPASEAQGCSLDEAWARQTLALAIERFRGFCRENGHQAWWDVFSARLLAPLMGEGQAYGFDTLAAKHGFAKPQDAANALVSAKRAFGRLLREIILDAVADPAHVDEELQTMIQALSRPAGAFRER